MSRKNNITPNQPAMVKVLLDQNLSQVQIAKKLTLECSLSVRSIRRRLVEAGLNGRIARKKPLVSLKNRRARVAFAREHLTWSTADWTKVVFSDESKFNRFGSDGKKYVRLHPGEEFMSKCTIPIIKHGGGSVVVWAVFNRNGPGPLHIIKDIMHSTSYSSIKAFEFLGYLREKEQKFHDAAANYDDAWKLSRMRNPAIDTNIFGYVLHGFSKEARMSAVRRRNMTIEGVWSDLHSGLVDVYKREVMNSQRYMELYTHVIIFFLKNFHFDYVITSDLSPNMSTIGNTISFCSKINRNLINYLGGFILVYLTLIFYKEHGF
uniref:HTH_Tnp_Tc3_2 domain-containing protein n=1 Tax=Heterorhabditis bacteriophora TaxID=37862 RepID=A0A1I7XT41_HETBA